MGRDGTTFGVGGVDGLIEKLAGGGVVFGRGAFDTLAKAKPTAHPRGQCGGAGPRGGRGRRRRSGEEEGLDVWKEKAANDDEEEEEKERGAPAEAWHIYTPKEDEACIYVRIEKGGW